MPEEREDLPRLGRDEDAHRDGGDRVGRIRRSRQHGGARIDRVHAITLGDNFAQQTFLLLAPLSLVDTIITDSGIDHELTEDLEAAGPRMVVV